MKEGAVLETPMPRGKESKSNIPKEESIADIIRRMRAKFEADEEARKPIFTEKQKRGMIEQSRYVGITGLNERKRAGIPEGDPMPGENDHD